MPLFLYLKEFLFFQHPAKFKKQHHRSIHNIRLQMIVDIQVFEFSNTCTVRASIAVVRLGQQATGHCLGTNGLLCTSHKCRKRYKQGAEYLLATKIGHLNNHLGTCGQCRVFPALRWLHSSMLGRSVSIDSAQ